MKMSSVAEDLLRAPREGKGHEQQNPKQQQQQQFLIRQQARQLQIETAAVAAATTALSSAQQQQQHQQSVTTTLTSILKRFVPHSWCAPGCVATACCLFELCEWASRAQFAIHTAAAMKGEEEDEQHGRRLQMLMMTKGLKKEELGWGYPRDVFAATLAQLFLAPRVEASVEDYVGTVSGLIGVDELQNRVVLKDDYDYGANNHNAGPDPNHQQNNNNNNSNSNSKGRNEPTTRNGGEVRPASGARAAMAVFDCDWSIPLRLILCGPAYPSISSQSSPSPPRAPRPHHHQNGVVRSNNASGTTAVSRRPRPAGGRGDGGNQHRTKVEDTESEEVKRMRRERRENRRRQKEKAMAQWDEDEFRLLADLYQQSSGDDDDNDNDRDDGHSDVDGRGPSQGHGDDDAVDDHGNTAVITTDVRREDGGKREDDEEKGKGSGEEKEKEKEEDEEEGIAWVVKAIADRECKERDSAAATAGCVCDNDQTTSTDTTATTTTGTTPYLPSPRNAVSAASSSNPEDSSSSSSSGRGGGVDDSDNSSKVGGRRRVIDTPPQAQAEAGGVEVEAVQRQEKEKEGNHNDPHSDHSATGNQEGEGKEGGERDEPEESKRKRVSHITLCSNSNGHRFCATAAATVTDVYDDDNDDDASSRTSADFDDDDDDNDDHQRKSSLNHHKNRYKNIPPFQLALPRDFAELSLDLSEITGIRRIAERFLGTAVISNRVAPPWVSNEIDFGHCLEHIREIPDSFLIRRNTTTSIVWRVHRYRRLKTTAAEKSGFAVSNIDNDSSSNPGGYVNVNTSRVTAVGNNFCLGCVSLRALDLTPLHRVETIGQHFLAHCDSITNLDLTPLGNSVTAVGEGFLGNCKSLKTIDVSPLRFIAEIKSNFMIKCVNLETIHGFGGVNTPPWTLERIGRAFLYGCAKLSELDIQSLHTVERVDEGFLYQCRSLRHVYVSPENKQVFIDSDFKGNKSIITAPNGRYRAAGSSYQSYYVKDTPLVYGLSTVSSIKQSQFTSSSNNKSNGGPSFDTVGSVQTTTERDDAAEDSGDQQQEQQPQYDAAGVWIPPPSIRNIQFSGNNGGRGGRKFDESAAIASATRLQHVQSPNINQRRTSACPMCSIQ